MQELAQPSSATELQHHTKRRPSKIVRILVILLVLSSIGTLAVIVSFRTKLLDQSYLPEFISSEQPPISPNDAMTTFTDSKNGFPIPIGSCETNTTVAVGKTGSITFTGTSSLKGEQFCKMLYTASTERFGTLKFSCSYKIGETETIFVEELNKDATNREFIRQYCSVIE